MKRLLISVLALCLLSGCGQKSEPAQIAATTLPVYEFTARLCEGTPLTVTRLVTEEVSCLHDYSLNVRQVKSAEAAETIVISGAGLEEFMGDILQNRIAIDASAGIDLLIPEHHHHDEEEESHEGHHHEQDPHIWLSPVHAAAMSENICHGLTLRYPKYQEQFQSNLADLQQELDDLNTYGQEQLTALTCRELITFHDGFSYLAEAFDLHILEAVEEESGSEASAKELIEIVDLVNQHNLPAIFTECNGSTAAATVISAETGAKVYALDMGMGGNSYFDAMYHNIRTVKEALG